MPSDQDKTGHIVADTGSSPGSKVSPQSSEAHSSEITRDAVVPPDKATQSSKPAAEAAVVQQTLVVDAASSQTEPAQHSAEPGEKLSPLETQLNQQTDDTLTHAGNAADQHDELAVDPQAGSENQRVVDEPVSDIVREPSQHQSVEHRELHAESTDSRSDGSDATAQHDHYHSVNDAEQSRPAAESDDDDDDDDVDEQHLSAEHREEQSEQPGVPRTSEPANDQDDSQQHNVNTDEVLDDPGDSANKPQSSDNAEVQLNRADSEDVAATTSDEQVTADGDESSVSSYFAPVVNLWTALDAWLMMSIDSVSSKCLLKFLPLFFVLWFGFAGTFFCECHKITHVSRGFQGIHS